MKNTSFIFYGSFHEAMSELNNAQYGALMRAINDYALNGVVPELKGMLKMAFILIKPQLDANLERRENGKGGGRSSITDDVKNDIIQDLQNGATQKDIAEKYNVAQSTVSNIKNEISLEISEISPEISQISLSKSSVYDNNEYQKPNVNVNDNDNDNDIPPETAGMPPMQSPDADNRSHSPTGNADSANSRKTPENHQHSLTAQSGVDNPAAAPPHENACNSCNADAPPDAGEPLRLAELLRDLHKAHDRRFCPSKKHVEAWAADIEKLHRIDRRDYADIERVIRWVKTAGNFWLSNIMSGAKLREKFAQVYAQMLQQQHQKPDNKRGGAWAGDHVTESDLERFMEIL